MTRLWQQIMKSEQGQALPIVLILLVVGGLMVVPSLDYAATSLNAGRIVEENVKGIYAADAGVEHVLWRLKNGSPPSSPYYLPEPVVNQMQQVAITTDEIGTYSLYDGELMKIGEHPQNFPGYLAVDREVWNEGGGTYKYIITVTWQVDEQGGPTLIHLEEVGVRLPVGYSYQSDSADIEGNLSRENPVDTLDGAGAHMLNWELGPPPPEVSEVNPTATQTFYVTGTGGPEGDYAWVDGLQSSVGQLGEVIGTLYLITATATSDSDHSTTIEAYVMISSIDYTTTEDNFILEAGQIYYDNVDAGGNVQLGQNAILNGNAIAGGNVQLEQGAIINGNACAGGDVQLSQDAIINGNVYAGGDVQLEPGATINGNVYAQGNVDWEGAVITGDIYPYEGCGVSLTGNRLEILNWEID